MRNRLCNNLIQSVMAWSLSSRFSTWATDDVLSWKGLALKGGQMIANSKRTKIIPMPSEPQLSFDFFVMSMSYQPEFCFQNKMNEFPGCESPEDFWRGSLTIHGLWPQYANGTRPSSCTSEPFNSSSVITSVGINQLEKYWPNVKTTEEDPSYVSFWAHEWQKHGTCSGLSQREYFQAALDNFLKTPDIVRNHYGENLFKSDLVESYYIPSDNGSHIRPLFSNSSFSNVVTVCKYAKYLSEVRVCIARREDGSPTTRMQCPESVMQDDSCDENIMIAKFPIDDIDEILSVRYFDGVKEADDSINWTPFIK